MSENREYIEKKKYDRETQARIEIGETKISPTMCWILIIFFFLTVFSFPFIQGFYEINRQYKQLQVFTWIPEFSNAIKKSMQKNISPTDKMFDTNKNLLEAINRYETGLENRSFLRKPLLSSVQYLFASWLNSGNEKAFVGNDGWLFYRNGITYLTQGGFLQADILKARSKKEVDVQVDPRIAIIDFARQLNERNIKLILLPVPVKPMIYPEKFSTHFSLLDSPLQNASFAKFKTEMEDAGITVIDLAPVMWQAKKSGIETFLRTDTHWTPAMMELCAKLVAEKLNKNHQLSERKKLYQKVPMKVKNQGDIALMLGIEAVETLYPLQQVSINKISYDKSRWQPSRQAEVLLLGDSFANIYSLPGMKWGDSAGLPEQLSYFMQRDIDCILRNDAGAYATRKILSRELRRNRDRLQGKKVVIWEFAVRELTLGNWPILPMKLEQKAESDFFSLETGKSIIVEATIGEISKVPIPGSVPYKDHVMTLHLLDIKSIDGSIQNKEALVCTMSMKDNVWTEAAILRPGSRIKLKLLCWDDVESRYGAYNRSELDGDLSLETPCWGEQIKDLKHE
jgi:alginate O-acetyltransferase complex protein AlgJ